MTAVQVILSVAIIEITCLYMIILLGGACLGMINVFDALEGIPGADRELMDAPAKRARMNVLKASALVFACTQLMAAAIVTPAPAWLAAAMLGFGGTVTLVACLLLVRFYINICESIRDHHNEMQSQRELAREREILDGGCIERRAPARMSFDDVFSSFLAK